MFEKSFLGLTSLGFHRIAYTFWKGPDHRVPLLCVHGLTRNGRDFDVLASTLSATRSVYCPDIVGRGKSSWLKDATLYGYPQYLADMTIMCDLIVSSLNHKEVDWVGTSMGGLIGMMLASYPNTPIRRLVINDVGPFISEGGLKRIGDYVGLMPEFADREAVIRYLKKNFASFGIKDDNDWAHMADHSTRRLPNGKMTLAHDPGIAKNFEKLKGDVDLWPIYEKIRIPTLVLHGTQSDILSKETAKKMTECGPKAQLVEWPDVGHAPALMEKEQIKVIEDFLR